MKQFNLCDEPWIPCMMKNGSVSEQSIKNCLANAQDIIKIVDKSPLVVISLHRFLLTIIHRNFPTNSIQDWISLWTRKAFDSSKINSYLLNWHEKFYLIDDEFPFYQTSETLETDSHPIWKIAAELASGNNATLFDHHYTDKEEIWSYAQTTRYLIAFQNYAVAGGVSKPFNFTDGPLTRGMCVLMMGDNLFCTLLLNLFLYTSQNPMPNSTDDMPIWERITFKTPKKEGTIPDGYLDLLTWQSRRLKCIPKDQGITKIQVLQNLSLNPETYDPMKAFRRSEERGLFPIRLEQDRVFWRDFHAMIQTTIEKGRRPQIFNHLAMIEEQMPEINQVLMNLSIFGFAFGESAAKIELWRHESIPITSNYSYDENLITAMGNALKIADNIGSLFIIGNQKTFPMPPLRRLAKEYLPDQKGAKDESGKLEQFISSLSAERQYWARLEIPFFEFVRNLSIDRQEDNSRIIYGQTALPQWRSTIKSIAQEIFQNIVRMLAGNARSLRALAIAQKEFNIQLAMKMRSEGGETSE